MEGAERTGIRRKVDDLGRVVIPATMRRTLGISEGDELEVSIDGDRLVLSRPADRCAFCHAQERLESFRSKVVCWSCMAAIRALDREHSAESARPFGL